MGRSFLYCELTPFFSYSFKIIDTSLISKIFWGYFISFSNPINDGSEVYDPDEFSVAGNYEK